jgi:hypothetical protein
VISEFAELQGSEQAKAISTRTLILAGFELDDLQAQASALVKVFDYDGLLGPQSWVVEQLLQEADFAVAIALDFGLS